MYFSSFWMFLRIRYTVTSSSSSSHYITHRNTPTSTISLISPSIPSSPWPHSRRKSNMSLTVSQLMPASLLDPVTRPSPTAALTLLLYLIWKLRSSKLSDRLKEMSFAVTVWYGRIHFRIQMFICPQFSSQSRYSEGIS